MAKADTDTDVLSIGITAMFDGAPGGGWVVRSESGGPYYQRYIRGGTSYVEGLGATTHTHLDQTTTSPTNNGGNAGNAESLGGGGTNAVSENGHTHLLTATGWSAANNDPPYYNVVIAEKVNFIFNHSAWYDDPQTSGSNTVSSRYSALDVPEDGFILPLPAGYNPPAVGKMLRLRIQILVNNSSLATGEMEFRLQYKVDTSTSLTSTTCTSGTWTDVGDSGDATAWRYVTSTNHPTDGGQLTGTSVFSSPSTSLQRYVRSTSAGTNIGAISPGETMEWDYNIINNNAVPATQYRFRLVEDSGILLSQYGYGSPTVTPVCPTLTTAPGTDNQLRHGDFFDNTENEKGFFWAD
jgi:hypothetical protein